MPLQRNPLIFLLLSAFLLCCVSESLAISPPSPHATIAARQSSSDPEPLSQQCGFQGDDNTYGLGIRVGLYLQWVTTTIASLAVPEAAANMRGVNMSFQLSTFIALLYVTITKGATLNSGQLYAVEVFILLTLCDGGVLTGYPQDREEEDSEDAPAPIAYILQVILTTAISFYSVWFVFTGMDQMAHPPCSQFAFFFAKVNLYHWFRSILKVAFVTQAADSVLKIVGICVDSWGEFFDVTVYLCLSRYTRSPTPSTGVAPPKERRRGDEASFAGVFVVFVTAVELVIRWNHIEGVQQLGSTGQMIPLVVALVGFIQVLWALIPHWRKGEYRDPLTGKLSFSAIWLAEKKNSERGTTPTVSP